MPPLPGEERMLTVFADIHYYFAAPAPKPLHHRFDKGSYVYIYHDAAHRKTRIEVANNPGTPEQDAFNGALDQVYLRHSSRFPTLCTLTVDGLGQHVNLQSYPPPPQIANSYEWRLPCNDPRDESNSLLRLHTLDIYFWTQDDANQFMDSAERLLSPTQMETDRHVLPSQSENNMSSVVQQLENVAVTDPAYQNGQTRNSRSDTGSNPVSGSPNLPGTSTLPPPPMGGPPPAQQQQQQPGTPGHQPAPEQSPLPYNPAAPAAPEPIQHREKTPPPVDGANGTGLAAAAAADQGIPYTPPSQITGGTLPSFAPPPTQSQPHPYTMPGAYASPPPSAGLSHSGSFSIQSPPGVPYSPTFHPGIAQQQQQFHPQQGGGGVPSFSAPPQDPNAHLYTQSQSQSQSQPQSIYSSPPPQQMQQSTTTPATATAPAPAPPIGGYSNYSYNQSQKLNPAVNEYDIHNQVYRPTEAEASTKSQKYAQQAMKSPAQRPRKLEDGANRVENNINRFLKKLEKKF